MKVEEIIQKALKENKILIGYRKCIKYLKNGKPKIIIVANNIPENIKKEFEHNAKIFNVKIRKFEGSSKDLGIFCGKPFPISVIAIKD